MRAPLPCSVKLELLREYAAATEQHNKALQEYGDMTTPQAKIEAEEHLEVSFRAVDTARQRYEAHLAEHGCEGGSVETGPSNWRLPAK